MAKRKATKVKRAPMVKTPGLLAPSARAMNKAGYKVSSKSAKV